MTRSFRPTLALVPFLLAGCIDGPAPSDQVARADFDAPAAFGDFCAACHGADARGGGPAAAGMIPPPPDLTRIAARNGGVFDPVAVMSKIDGYRIAGHTAMPEFGALILDAPRVLVETGEGVFTPTPEPLAAMAEYLESLQR